MVLHDVLEYNFENTLQKSWLWRCRFGSHLKFKVPSNLDSNTTFKMVNIDKFDNITDTFGSDLGNISLDYFLEKI